MGCSMPGFPLLHHLPELAQTHVHWIGDAIQPPPPLSPPSPPAFSLFQHQGIFQWVSSLHLVAKVLDLQLQHQSFQWIVRVDFLSDWLVWSPYCPRDSQESSPAPQFESINSSTLSLLYGPTLTFVHDYWNWSIVDLQCCVCFRYTAKWFTCAYMYIFFFFQIISSCRLSPNIEYSSWCYTVGPCWLSILYI